MGTTPYPDERSLRLAARRGVVLTASHFEILGFNAFAWSQAFARESTQLWDWTTHPDMMSHTWAATIAAQQEYEMIWSVGLRGLNDYAYVAKYNVCTLLLIYLKSKMSFVDAPSLAYCFIQDRMSVLDFLRSCVVRSR